VVPALAPGKGGDVGDARPTDLPKERNGGAADQHRRIEIGGDPCTEKLEAQLLYCVPAHEVAGVVHQDIETCEDLGDRLEQRGDAALSCEIGAMHDRTPAGRGDDPDEVLRLPGAGMLVDEDISAHSRDRPRDGAHDACVSSRDERLLPLQRIHARRPP